MQLSRQLKAELGKTYATAAEELERAAIFARNLAKVKQHNAQPEKTWWAAAHSPFADWTNEEFRAQRTGGTIRSDDDDDGEALLGSVPDTAVVSASSLDWRDTPGVVTAVNCDTATLGIRYDDGDEEADVPRLRVRLEGQKMKRDLEVGTRCLTYAWRNESEGTILGVGTSVTLTSSTASPDDEISCTATASDDDGGTDTDSDSVSLSNRTPDVTASISPSTGVTTATTLTCSGDASEASASGA